MRPWALSALFLLSCDSGPSSTASTKKAPAATGPGAANLTELRERAFRALRDRDDDSYLELLASPAFLAKHCAAEPGYSDLDDGGAVAARAVQRHEVRSALAGCMDAFDWSRATLDRIEGGEAKKESGLSCDPPAKELEDLTSFYRVGGETWRVKVANDVYLVAGRYVVLDMPACERRDR